MLKNRKRLRHHIALFCVILIGACFGCPIYELSGICCPLCGTTRAWIHFLSGEIKTAFRYHPLFLITPFWFFAAVHYNSIFKKNKFIGFALICIALALAILNLLRIAGFLPRPG
jgi:uncharacterized membrane protein YwzB